MSSSHEAIVRAQQAATTSVRRKDILMFCLFIFVMLKGWLWVYIFCRNSLNFSVKALPGFCKR